MNNQIIVAAAAIPGTMFVPANIGSSTAQMTGADHDAIRQSLVITSVAMLIAAGATSNLIAVMTTGLAIAAVFYAMRHVWQTPTIQDFIPGDD